MPDRKKKGTLVSAIPSDLSAADADRYLSLLKKAEEVRFEHSGHMIPDEEPEKYVETVRGFLAKVDGLVISRSTGETFVALFIVYSLKSGAGILLTRTLVRDRIITRTSVFCERRCRS